MWFSNILGAIWPTVSSGRWEQQLREEVFPSPWPHVPGLPALKVKHHLIAVKWCYFPHSVLGPRNLKQLSPALPTCRHSYNSILPPNSIQRAIDFSVRQSNRTKLYTYNPERQLSLVRPVARWAQVAGESGGGHPACPKGFPPWIEASPQDLPD